MLKIDDGSVLLHPGVCSLCSSQPTKGEYAIDTEFPFVDANARHLVGHKYVCQKCAEALAELVPNKALDRAKTELKKYKAAYAELVAALDTVASRYLRVSD